MNAPEKSWPRLAAAARAARDERADAAPYGFATRVVASAFAAPAPSPWALFERVALRGLLAAAVCGTAALVFGLTSGGGSGDDEVASTDSLSEVLELS